MISKDNVVCPFCKYKHSKTKALGTSGLICQVGEEEKKLTCDKCGKDFLCDIEITYRFKTSK